MTYNGKKQPFAATSIFNGLFAVDEPLGGIYEGPINWKKKVLTIIDFHPILVYSGYTHMHTASLQKSTTISYLSERLVLILLLVLKESVQAVFLHDDLRLVREEDGVAIERHSQLSLAQLILRFRHKHCGCGDA